MKRVTISRSSVMKVFKMIGINQYGFSTYIQSNFVILERVLRKL
jgi:hypothetical protein